MLTKAARRVGGRVLCAAAAIADVDGVFDSPDSAVRRGDSVFAGGGGRGRATDANLYVNGGPDRRLEAARRSPRAPTWLRSGGRTRWGRVGSGHGRHPRGQEHGCEGEEIAGGQDEEAKRRFPAGRTMEWRRAGRRERRLPGRRDKGRGDCR